MPTPSGAPTPGEYKLIDSGRLPEAVAASAAIPLLFNAVHVPGQTGMWADGGKVDRCALQHPSPPPLTRKGLALAVGTTSPCKAAPLMADD